jgi:type I restriction enzyme S subunit
MNNYPIVELDEVCKKITVGFVGSMVDEYVDEGVLFLRSQNILPFNLNLVPNQVKYISNDFDKKISKSKLYPGDIAIVRTGYPGTACVIPKDFKDLNCSDLVIVRPDNSKIDSDYLCNYINSPIGKGAIFGSLVGVAQQHFNVGVAKKMKIKLPPLPIQNKIASILSSYDELIENNKQRINLLEEMAEEIYKEWFVRLRFPGYESSKFYTSRGQAVIYNTIGAIPENWQYSLLENHIEFFRGKSYSSEELRDNEGLPMLNLKNINRGGSFRRDGLKYFEGKFSKNNLAYSGDIIMAVTDMTQNREIVGRVARVPEMNINKFIFSMDLIRIEPIGYPKNFIYSFFRYSGIGLKLAEFANGANVLHLTPSLITKQKARLPTIELAEKFEKIVNPFLDEIDVLENKNQLLQETRDLLLPRLISGKLSVAHLIEEELKMVAEPIEEYSKTK